MKVLFIIQNLRGGGRERRMLQLLKGLRGSSEIKTYLVLVENAIDYNDVYDYCDDIIILSENKPALKCKEIKNIIKRICPDIVHSWCDIPYIMFYLPLLKASMHFKYIAGFVASATPIPIISVSTLCMHTTFAAADAIVSNSQAGLDAKHAPLKKALVIYNGFDYNRFSNVIDKMAYRESLGISTKYVAGMFARFYDAKDYDTFLSVAELSLNAEDITFLAVGDGPNIEKYKVMAREKQLDNVLFLGLRKDVENLVRITDMNLLFTNPRNHAEGLSNSIMESMAAGKPVIATKGGGSSEIISDGVNGFLVDGFDYASAHSRLKQMVEDSDLLQLLSEAAVDTIRKNFSLDKMVEEYVKLYHKLIKLR